METYAVVGDIQRSFVSREPHLMWMRADFHATEALELSIVETNRPSDLLADDERRLLTEYRRRLGELREGGNDRTHWHHD